MKKVQKNYVKIIKNAEMKNLVWAINEACNEYGSYNRAVVEEVIVDFFTDTPVGAILDWFMDDLYEIITKIIIYGDSLQESYSFDITFNFAVSDLLSLDGAVSLYNSSECGSIEEFFDEYYAEDGEDEIVFSVYRDEIIEAIDRRSKLSLLEN